MTGPGSQQALSLVILMPVYNDWESAAILCRQLDKAMAGLPAVLPRILCVDDGSTLAATDGLRGLRLAHIGSLEVLRLRRNLGHQRAIAVGLTYVYQNQPGQAVVCMDADGEDRAEDVGALFEKFVAAGGKHAIFAARRKRLEGFVFRFGYFLYRQAHRVLTGFGVKIGNFSILPFTALETLVVSPELWSHYAAAAVKCRISMETVGVDRGRRFAGKSKMNYVSLVSHGLSAISVFGDLVATRMLIGGAMLFLLAIVACGVILLGSQADSRLVTVALTLLLIVTDVVVVTAAIAFAVLSKRDQAGFLPLRDASYFIAECVRYEPGDRIGSPLQVQTLNGD